MRFFLDHDVSSEVGSMLRSTGHDCWTAHDAHLSEATDDELTVYAGNKGAALLTHDREFSRRRRLNATGWHIYLRCNEWEAASLLSQHLDFVIEVTRRHADVFIAMSLSGCELSFAWTSP